MTSYNFKLADLEEDVCSSYSELIENNNDTNRIKFFETTKKLSFAIVSISKRGRSFSHKEKKHLAYEYSLKLLERVVFKEYRFKYKTRMPFQAYISQSIKKTISNYHKDRNSFTQIDFLLEKFRDISFRQEDKLADRLERDEIALQILSNLEIFYNKEEITKYFNLFFNFVDSVGYDSFSTKRLPNGLMDFYRVLICITKRIAKNYRINLNYFDYKKSDVDKKALAACNSSIFLSLITDRKIFPKEFLLALDIDSLYRLCSILGSKTVKIPTLHQLDTLIGGAMASVKHILGGETIEKAVAESKKDLDLVYTRWKSKNNCSVTNPHYFVSKAVEVAEKFGEEKYPNPFFGLFLSSLSSIEDILSEKSINLLTKKHKKSLKKDLINYRECLDNIIKRFDGV